jgi:hypothetical protein
MAHFMWVGQLTWRGVCALTMRGGEGDTPEDDGPCGWPILRSTQHGGRPGGGRRFCDVFHARRS